MKRRKEDPYPGFGAIQAWADEQDEPSEALLSLLHELGNTASSLQPDGVEMEIRQLKTFKAVADALGFHKAAERLHYAQSTVSAQIQGLEDELGVRLFDRLGRSILLTQAGESLYNYACKMIDLEEEARAELEEQSEILGALTIRVPESVCVHRLPAVVRLFRSRMPKVSLRFITCAQEGLGKDLRKGVTDLAFLLAESIQSGDLEVKPLSIETLVMVASPEHPLADASRVETSDLSGRTLLLSRVDCSYRRLLESLMREEGTKPEMVLEFNSLAAIIACVASGVGLSVVPEVAVRSDLERGSLVRLPWSEDGLEVACLMIWHRDKWLSPALKGFMNTAVEMLK